MIVTRTPLRISLIGGGTDMPAFYKKHAGIVISFSIDKYVYVITNEKFDGTYRICYSKTENVEKVGDIEHDIIRETLKQHKVTGGEFVVVSDIPGHGTGLGSSSALTVGLLKAITNTHEPAVLAENAFMIENEKCGHPVGKQDQYASAYGGVNHILFGRNSVKVTPLNFSDQWKCDLEKNSLLLWTGIQRDGNKILEKQRKSFSLGNNVSFGIQMADLAHVFYQELLDNASYRRLGELMDEAWKLKKFFADGVSNSNIDVLYEKAVNAGAFGGKLLGAGGGGFLFLLADPVTHDIIQERTGLRKIEYKISNTGSEVIYDGQETKDVVC